MTHYDDLVLPNTQAFGSAFGPRTATQILRTVNGFRKTNRLRSGHLHEFNVEYAVESDVDIYILKEIFEAVDGPAHSFLARDWSDWNTSKGQMDGVANAGDPTTPTDAPMRNTTTDLYVGDGSTVTFQLVKRYQPTGSAAVHNRDIRKPELGIKVAINGSTTGGFSYSSTSGILTFSTALTSTEAGTWGGNFLVPCAFMVDSFDEVIQGFNENAVAFTLEEVFGV